MNVKQKSNLIKIMKRLLWRGRRDSGEKGQTTVEFMFAFLLFLWMCMGFLDILFQAYNGMIINYGSYMGARSYIVSGDEDWRWQEAAETIARGTLMYKEEGIRAEESDDEITLEVENEEMLKSGIIYGDGANRTGILQITTTFGEQEDEFSGDNAPYPSWWSWF